MFSELFPIIVTANMAGALAFYRDLLGGAVAFEYPGPDGAPAYVGLEIGGSQLGLGLELGEVPPAGQGPRPVSLWVYAEDCDAAVERLRAAGTRVTEEPADQPWGERVARVLDPDGNEVIIGQRATTGGYCRGARSTGSEDCESPRHRSSSPRTDPLMRAIRSVLPTLLLLTGLGACGADSGPGATQDDEPSAAPQTAPGLEPAEVPESLQEDSSAVN